MSLYNQFENHVSTRFKWTNNEPIVVAVSGGVDSIVLLDLLARLPRHLKPKCIIAHINHHLRAESDEEEQFVRQLAAKEGLSICVHHWEKKDHPISGIEEAARHVRYRFFNQVAQEMGAQYILTAHHQNDQVETIMMKWVRGSSLEELTGIKEVRRSGEHSILRPLLPFSKAQLIRHAKMNELNWVEDTSNQSMTFSRNRFRNSSIPLMKEENQAVEENVIRISNEISEWLDIITPCIEAEVKRTTSITTESLTLDIPHWLSLNEALRKRVLTKALILWNPDGKLLVKQKHIELINDWLKESKPNASIDLSNGLIAQRSYDTCSIVQKVQSQQAGLLVEGKLINQLNTWVRLSKNEKIGLFTLSAYEKMTLKNTETLFLGNEVALPLNIRHRKNGDRMTVKGLNGTKKLKSIFIDDKVPLQERNQAWVVEDDEGTIIWVIGYRESSLSLDPITDTIIYVLVYEQETQDD